MKLRTVAFSGLVLLLWTLSVVVHRSAPRVVSATSSSTPLRRSAAAADVETEEVLDDANVGVVLNMDAIETMLMSPLLDSIFPAVEQSVNSQLQSYNIANSHILGPTCFSLSSSSRLEDFSLSIDRSAASLTLLSNSSTLITVRIHTGPVKLSLSDLSSTLALSLFCLPLPCGYALSATAFVDDIRVEFALSLDASTSNLLHLDATSITISTLSFMLAPKLPPLGPCMVSAAILQLLPYRSSLFLDEVLLPLLHTSLDSLLQSTLHSYWHIPDTSLVPVSDAGDLQVFLTMRALQWDSFRQELHILSHISFSAIFSSGDIYVPLVSVTDPLPQTSPRSGEQFALNFGSVAVEQMVAAIIPLTVDLPYTSPLPSSLQSVFKVIFWGSTGDLQVFLDVAPPSFSFDMNLGTINALSNVSYGVHDTAADQVILTVDSSVELLITLPVFDESSKTFRGLVLSDVVLQNPQIHAWNSVVSSILSLIDDQALFLLQEAVQTFVMPSVNDALDEILQDVRLKMEPVQDFPAPGFLLDVQVLNVFPQAIPAWEGESMGSLSCSGDLSAVVVKST